MSDPVITTEEYPAGTSTDALQRECQLKREAGASDCQIIENADGSFTLRITWPPF